MNWSWRELCRSWLFQSLLIAADTQAMLVDNQEGCTKPQALPVTDILLECRLHNPLEMLSTLRFINLE